MRSLKRVSGVMCLMLCGMGVARADVKSASLNVEQTTDVPGGQLKPGTYTIGIIDSLNDRVVLHIDDPSGKTRLTFLGVAKSPVEGGRGSHPVQWNTGAAHKHFLRGYDFGSDYVEFVYPKQYAVAIAKANNVGVVAIDPKSESRPELKKLTAQDRQMVTLWMLTPVEVGSTHGIEAKHFTGAENTANPVSVAAATTAQPVAPAIPARSSNQVANARPAAPLSNEIAELHKPARPRAYQPAIKRLPQTASQLPLLWMVGLGSLCAASVLRLRKLVA